MPHRFNEARTYNKCSRLRLRFYLAQWELLECLIADARNFITALESKFMALVNSFLR